MVGEIIWNHGSYILIIYNGESWIINDNHGCWIEYWRGSTLRCHQTWPGNRHQNEGLDLGKSNGGIPSFGDSAPRKYPEMAKSHESWTAYDHQVAIEQVKWWSPAASLPDPIDYSWVLYFNTSKKKWKRSSQLNASPELAWSPDLKQLSSSGTKEPLMVTYQGPSKDHSWKDGEHLPSNKTL